MTCPTAATTSRGGLGRGAVAAAVSLSEQILQGAANAKRHSPQSSSASSEGNDDAAMAVIMSLLEVSGDTERSIGYCAIIVITSIVMHHVF